MLGYRTLRFGMFAPDPHEAVVGPVGSDERQTLRDLRARAGST